MSFAEKMQRFNNSDDPWISLLRDIVSVFMIIIIFASIFQVLFGLWSPMVAVESGSMIPHIQIGDIIFVENIHRTKVISYEEGKRDAYMSFDEPGDVILYMPYGQGNAVPIIHRAMYYVEKGEPMWKGGPLAPHSGYLTKGDNEMTNPLYDQQGSISYMQPIKKEWIIGVARFRPIPIIGYISIIPRKILSRL